MNNLFKDFCNSINYDTYEKIGNIMIGSTIGFEYLNEHLLSQYPIINNSIDCFSYAAFVFYLYYVFSSGKFNTKDVSYINSLYQEFIRNYNDLNREFNFDNPIQIHTMFNYLLYNGYLSKDKNFEFTSKYARDINPIKGANVIMGSGVCRHIAAMLVDIFNDCGIEAFRLGCHIRESVVKFGLYDEEKMSREELDSWIRLNINDRCLQEKLYLAVDEAFKEGKYVKLSFDVRDNKDLIEKILGNHAICLALKDNKSYFLDPTQFRVYRLSECDKKILYDDNDDNIKIKLISSIIIDNFKNYLALKSRLFGSDVLVEEEKEMIDSTLSICRNNMDIFDSFYNTNRELYDDISNRLVKIKRSNFIKK